MSKSNIEWTSVTWNPTTGCTKISKECENCYAEKLTKRYMHMPNHVKYHQGFDKFVMHEDALNEPFKWKEPKTVFVNSMSDLFHKDVKLEFLKKVFAVMNNTPQHTYQILTKRAHVLRKYSDQLTWSDNIWMGVSVGHKAGERRIQDLVNSGAKHKFLSVEPLIEELNDLNLEGIDWVIVGGESGDNKSRLLKKEWVLKVQRNCKEHNVPFFFKQWGKKKNNPDLNDPTMNKEHIYYAKGGCMLDGKLYLDNPTMNNPISLKSIKLFKKEYYVTNELDGLITIWELQSYFPTMEEPLFRALKNDIKKNGLNDPILYIKTEDGIKLVIDGHTRLKACMEIGKKKVPSKEINVDFNSLDEIKLWMVTHQCRKRNLSIIEKVKYAYLFKPTLEKMAKENLSKAGKKERVEKAIDTFDQLSNLAGVGRSTFVRYNNIIEKGSKEILNKLEKGEISIYNADKIVKQSKPKKIQSKQAKTNYFDFQLYIMIDDAQKDLEENKIKGFFVFTDEAEAEKIIKMKKKEYGLVII